MFSIQDFSIISTEYDYQLFFSSDYQRVVTAAINKIMDRIEYSEDLQLLAYEKFILIRNARVNPSINEIEILDDYNPEIDRNSFNLGVIAIPQQ